MTLGNQMNVTSWDQAFENEIIVYVYRNMRVRPNEAEFDQDWYFVNDTITQGCFKHMFEMIDLLSNNFLQHVWTKFSCFLTQHFQYFVYSGSHI